MRVVLRADLSGHPTFRALLSRIREVAAGAYANQDVPLQMLLAKMPPQHRYFSELLVHFNFMEGSWNAPQFPGLTVSRLEPGEPKTITPILLALTEERHGLRVQVAYERTVYSTEKIAEFLAGYRSLMEQLVGAPDQCCLTLPVTGLPDRGESVPR
jgi:non-ribosomal peptide synthetase component F